MDPIRVRGARTHNLKDLDVDVPRHQVVVFTGVSGSGKSSLVFDTLYTEAQRQLVETFSTFARRRLFKLSRPDVDVLENISTAIVIDQRKMGANVRSTVGTATEIAPHLRMLYSRVGTPRIGPSFFFGFNHPEGMCPTCQGIGERIRIDTELLLDRAKSVYDGAIGHPDYRVGGWRWREMTALGLFDVHKRLNDYSGEELHTLLYAKGIPVEKPHGSGAYTKIWEGVVTKLERLHVKQPDGPTGVDRQNAYQRYFLRAVCPDCHGSRLNERARCVTVGGVTIDRLCNLELWDVDRHLATLTGATAAPLVRTIRGRLGHLADIGVGYLSLNRGVATLSGGESQRVKMARQLDCDLVDLMYVLDEPSVGLHPRDTQRLILMLRQLKARGNSVLVVEHDADVIRAADHIIDVGPGPGTAGGGSSSRGVCRNC